MPPSPPVLLTPAEAAAILRVTVRTLANWADDGDIRCVTLKSGHRRFYAADVQRYIDTHTRDKAAS